MTAVLRIHCQSIEISHNAVAIIHWRDHIVLGQGVDYEVNEKRSDIGLILKAKTKGFLSRIKLKYETQGEVKSDCKDITMSRPNVTDI